MTGAGAAPASPPGAARARPPARRRRRWPAVVAALLVAVPAAGLLAAFVYLRASGAETEGTVAVAGLRGPVTVARDELGAVTLRGAERGDLAFATGFVHAQERWFQMDLMRRAGAGELAALLGPALAAVDEARRIHRFRRRAELALAQAAPAERALLERYAEGVNAGLSRLAARPFEYALLRQAPQPWRPEDSLLVVYAMYFDLQDDQLGRVWSRGWLRDHGTSAEQLAFLLPTATAYDTPLDAAQIAAAPAPIPASAPAWFGQPLPAAPAARGKVAAAGRDGADAFAAKGVDPLAASPADALASGLAASLFADPGDARPGSNNAAIAGPRSATGAAIVSVDMHLGLRLPPIWFRAAIETGPGGGPPTSRLVGVTLPGVPLVVAGSNGRVAWGFTNSYGQYLDLVELDLEPADAGREATRFRSGGGWTALVRSEERIEVAGEPPRTLAVDESPFGPVRRIGGKAYAVRWAAHDPGATNVAFVAMEAAATVPEALAIGARSGLPAQNMVAGDRSGRIGWTIAGPLPDRRTDFASTFPRPASAPVAALGGWRAFAASNPQVVDPPGGQLTTSNGRQLAEDAAQAAIGDGGADLGARGRQLRDALWALGPASAAGARVDEAAVHATMLDDRALYLAPWRDRALRALAGLPSPAASAVANSAIAPLPSGDPAASAERDRRRLEFAQVLGADWSGRADVGSAGYTLARAWVAALYRRLFGAVDARLAEAGVEGSFARASQRWPALLARLLDEQPPGWLPAGARDWRELELLAVDDAAAAVTAGLGGERPRLADARWGPRNAVRVAHPLAGAIPLLARFLAAPNDPQAGDNHMPRVSAPSFGQSERLVVSPGHEERGLFAMPGGQSGHPASPWFLAGHRTWVEGGSQALLPGPARQVLTLTPLP